MTKRRRRRADPNAGRPPAEFGHDVSADRLYSHTERGKGPWEKEYGVQIWDLGT